MALSAHWIHSLICDFFATFNIIIIIIIIFICIIIIIIIIIMKSQELDVKGTNLSKYQTFIPFLPREIENGKLTAWIGLFYSAETSWCII